jgi:hypothetical protein
MKTIFRLGRMLIRSFIVITLVAYYLLTIQSIMLEQNTLKCTIILSKKKVLLREIDLIHVNNKNHVVSIFHTCFKYRQVIEIQKHFWCIKCGLELEWEC